MEVGHPVPDALPNAQFDSTSRTAVAVVLASTLFALIAQEFLFDSHPGMGLALVVFTGIAFSFILQRLQVLALRPVSRGLMLATGLFALGLALNDSRGLPIVNSLMIAVTLGFIVAIETVDGKPKLIHSAIVAPLAALVFPIVSLAVPFCIKLQAIKPRRNSKAMSGAMLGLVAAVPVLLVLGTLLADADPVFRRFFSFSWQIDGDAMAERAVIFGLVGSFAAGLWALTSSTLRKKMHTVMIAPNQTATNAPPKYDTPVSQLKPMDPMQAMTAFTTFFALIGGLFLIFVLVQARYLFGGNDMVLKTEGLTFAQYARQGFFEIVTVTGITIPLLLLAQSLLQKVEDRHRTLFKVVAWGMSALLLCLLASATVRMSLYVNAYGLSPLRFYVSSAMVWLAIVVGMYAWMGVRWQLPKFGMTCVYSFLGIGVLLNVVRPDATIVSVNLSRKGSEVDQAMILESGADAWGAIQSASPKLKEAWLTNFAEQKRNWKSLSFAEWKVHQTGLVPAPAPKKEVEETAYDGYELD